MMQRVAAYCRVSTDKEDQANSLESQKRYFYEYIRNNPQWQLTELYVDEGITGTSTKKRRSFHKMIGDAQNRRFDLLLTKEISRFARNTLDSIYYTRKLKEWGVGVIFLRDNINTLDPDAELRLTIMASIAQEESRKTSDRVKWGQKRRMEQGVVFGRSLLGYDVKGGEISINEEGAEVVRLIFHKFVVEGKGTHVIARELREAGIPTFRCAQQWSNTAILRALRNEKYCGDLVQKKTITPDYLTHEKKRNCGEEELVVLRDHHPPIVDRGLWERAQKELARRAPSGDQRSRHSNRYCFSGKLRCGVCGAPFVPRIKKRKDGSDYRAWRCQQAANWGRPHIDAAGNRLGCDGRQLGHEDLLLVMGQVVRSLEIEREEMVAGLLEVIEPALAAPQSDQDQKQLRAKMRQVQSRRERLIEAYLMQEIGRSDFMNLSQKYQRELGNLEAELTRRISEKASGDNRSEALDEIAASLRGMLSGGVTEELFYRSLLDYMIVYGRERLEVFLYRLPGCITVLLGDAAV
ncbi:recombinase family protein [Ligaoa zhengdingensis]|uniref:recombinase family protein n=1 Tax=Ligaoa zhengdingensis TaxID=2763658 RepID=UPI0031BA7892